MDDKKQQIAQQNDLFRKNFGTYDNEVQEVKGRYNITEGLSNLPILEQFAITIKIRNFNDFNENNDPYKEHDLGTFKLNTHDIIWKIDYYDLDYHYGSEDPSDLSKTRRVLTAMLAHEY